MAVYIAIAVSLLLIFGNIRYATEIIKGTVIPTKSSWLIFSIVTGLNVASFLTTKFDLVSGAYGITDFLTCVVILIIALIVSRKEKVIFKRFEKYYLLCVSVCIIFWIITNNSFYTNLLVQLLIVIGYFPTMHNILVSRKSTESKQAWTIWLTGMVLSLYPAMANHNTLAIIYALRGTVMILAILALIYKFSAKKQSREKNRPA